MAASSAFESSLRRGNPTTTSRKTTPSSSESSRRVAAAPPPRRSRSVSAFSRNSSCSDFSEFSTKRDNPLFDNNRNSNDDDDGGEALFPNSGLKSDRIISKTKLNEAVPDDYNNRRGRSVSRNGSDGKHGSGPGKSNNKDSSRSLSVVDTRRRGRSVSRTPLSRTHFATSESEVEQEGISSVKSKNKGNLSATSANGQKVNLARTGSSLTRSGHQKPIDPSDSFPTSLGAAKQNNAVLTSSFSEAELTESFQGNNLVGDATAASNIYRAVKLEVRRAISDIQNELQGAWDNTSEDPPHTLGNIHAIRSNATTEVVELVSDIQHEYVTKLEQSQERARQLRADLAVEEHRGMELSRILKEVLPDAKTPSTKKTRPRRKSSIERRKMSKCLTEDALAYFDECVSLSTFDGSDFSSVEDPPLKLVGIGTDDLDGVSLPHENSSITASNYPSSYLNDKQECQSTYSHDPSDLTDCNSSMEQTQDPLHTDRGWSRKFQFSFSTEPNPTSCELQQDIKKYIKGFKKYTGKINIDSQVTRKNSYDPDEYNLPTSQQSLLFDQVFLKNRLESGSLLLCNGGCFSTPFLPFAPLI